MKMPALKATIERQLRQWSVAGPVERPAGAEAWAPAALDGARHVPASFRRNGKPSPLRRLTARDGHLDLAADLGEYGGTRQAFVFCEVTVPCDVTLQMTYDADWSAVWWLDGGEIAATRGGNCGPVGPAHHPMLVGLRKGRHLFTVRLATGLKGWTLITTLRDCRAGLDDLLVTGRDARWRDYRRALVRHENRPAPDGTCGGVPKETFERLLANGGVDARWIGVVHHTQGSHFPSRFLPVWSGARPEYAAQLKEWVGVLHRHRIAALSWYPLTHCEPAAVAHPDWHQKYLVPPVAFDHGSCCTNSPYGDAVIRYAIEALRTFDLDGIWFDGAYFSPISMSPQPVSCSCRHCRRKFKRDTGLDLPDRFDWSLPEFRRWVQWRYDMFSAYWQKLVDAIHAAVPQATVVFNHYHRENTSWNAAVPLKPFGHDFVSGTEADSEPLKGAFYTRCMRAYGRPDTEVWMELKGREATPRGPIFNPRDFMDFALSCATAGGHASFGGGEADVEMGACRGLADEMKPREPHLNLPSEPWLALHISQQTETFVFGRNPEFTSSQDWNDYYWNSATGWHHALAFAGRPCDVIFDAHLTPAHLSRYPIVVSPLAVALTSRQHKILLDYVTAGGVLVTGPWFGLCDEEGEPHAAGPVGDRALFPFGDHLPTWTELKQRPELTFRVPVPGKTRPGRLTARPLAVQTLRGNAIPLDWRRNPDLCRITRVGEGRIIQLAVDAGTLYRYSQSPLAVQALSQLLADLPRPSVEVVGGEPLLMGIFRKGPRRTVVHLQQFSLPWDPAARAARQPPARWGTVLRGNGPPPRAVRCALPEPGPELEVVRRKASWQVTLPPMTWGQVVLIDR
jgi:hypothetical protein